MEKEIELKLKLTLCDRNRNFDEILESIYKVIRERDGVDGFIVLDKIEVLK